MSRLLDDEKVLTALSEDALIRNVCSKQYLADILKRVTPEESAWTDNVSLKPFDDDTVQCVKCGFYSVKDNVYRYCPNCGRKIRHVSEVTADWTNKEWTDCLSEK